MSEVWDEILKVPSEMTTISLVPDLDRVLQTTVHELDDVTEYTGVVEDREYLSDSLLAKRIIVEPVVCGPSV